MNRKFKRTAFIGNIFNIVNVFTVTFDPFDESLLNKNITLFFFMLLTPNIILNQVKYKQGVCLSAYKKHHRQTRVTHYIEIQMKLKFFVQKSARNKTVLIVNRKCVEMVWFSLTCLFTGCRIAWQAHQRWSGNREASIGVDSECWSVRC